MKMLNQEMLVEALQDSIYEDACYDGEKPSPLESWEDVHDASLCIVIGNLQIESHDIMYGEMLTIINAHWEEIADEVNDYMDEHCQSYYGDPAFSSASDYWGYIMGR